MLGTVWLALHTVLALCARSDRTLAWAVLGFLFFVTTLPFPASVLADHVHIPLAVVLYWLNLALLGASLPGSCGTRAPTSSSPRTVPP